MKISYNYYIFAASIKNLKLEGDDEVQYEVLGMERTAEEPLTRQCPLVDILTPSDSHCLVGCRTGQRQNMVVSCDTLGNPKDRKGLLHSQVSVWCESIRCQSGVRQRGMYTKVYEYRRAEQNPVLQAAHGQTQSYLRKENGRRRRNMRHFLKNAKTNQPAKY